MTIAFSKLINEKNKENSDKYDWLRDYTLKQISRCKFEIIDDKCIVKARYKDEIVEVVIENNIDVYHFFQLFYYVNDEPSPQYMRSRIKNFEISLFEMLKDYKSNNYIIGERIKNDIFFKIYSQTPLSNGLRDLYDARWIDYEKQLERGAIFYDEGVAGLWAMPAEMLLKCFNDECKDNYGGRIFILKPVVDCFYLNDGKEIIGDKYEVVEKLSMDNANDMGKLANYLVEDVRRIEQRKVLEKENEIRNVRKERESYLSERNSVIDANRRLVEKIRITRVMWLFIGGVAGFIIKIIMTL